MLGERRAGDQGARLRTMSSHMPNAAALLAPLFLFLFVAGFLGAASAAAWISCLRSFFFAMLSIGAWLNNGSKISLLVY